MSNPNKLKKEKTPRTVMNFLPPILTFLGIIVGLWQFNAEQKHRDKDLFRQKIWEKKLEFYEKLGNATAKVVNSTQTSSEFDTAILEFNHLYWGVLPMIQDGNVEQAIIRFNSEIRYFKRQESSLEDLRIKGYKVMTECKVSLDTSWEKLMDDEK